MIQMTRQTRYVDLAALGAAPLVDVPFPFVVVPCLIRSDRFAEICAEFPKIESRGSYPLSALKYGTAFGALCQELCDPSVRDHFQEKLRIDLHGRPATITVRGQTDLNDGAIHVDSRTKLVTVLVYLNDEWSADGGRLRLLRSAEDIDNMVAEVPPSRGAAVAFVNTPRAWHGHKKFVGPRRSIQLNWVTSRTAALSADRRHALSAGVKKVFSGWR